MFSKVNRLGRAATASIVRSLAGEPFEPYLCLKVLDQLVGFSGGFAAWPRVMRELVEQQNAPLFFQADRGRAADLISDICRSEGGGLDDVLRGAAEAEVLRGVAEPFAVMSRCMLDLLDRAVLSPRGGCFEQIRFDQRAAVREMVRPLAERAAQVLVERPNAKRTGLARSFTPGIRAHDNLLGGTP